MAWQFDFFRQFNSFADLSIGNLDTNAFALYIRLLMINNKAGRVEWFGVTNERLIIECGLNEKSIIKARNDLIQKGFILYSKGKKGSPSRYSIVPLDENFLKGCNNFTVFYTPNNLQGIFDSEYGSKSGSVSDRENGSINGSESCSHIRVEKNNLKKSKDDDVRACIFSDKSEIVFDDSAKEAIRYFQQLARPLASHETKQLSALTQKFSTHLVKQAIDIAVDTCRKKGDKIQSINFIDSICAKLKKGGELNANHLSADSGKPTDSTDPDVVAFLQRPAHSRRKRSSCQS